MEKELKKIGSEVVKAVETMKDAGANNTPKPSAKDAKKSKADELQQEIDRKTEELQKCLAELERKKKLSQNRTSFIQALDKLEQATVKLSEEDTFETKSYRLRFENTTAYHGEDVFSISNNFILDEFIIFMKEKIQMKISEIEQQLIME